MLKKSHISNIQIYTQEWDLYRVGRLTSSRISSIMSENGISKSAGMGYLYQKAGEYITKKSMAVEDEVIEDENTSWGRENEPAAIRKFGEIKGINFLVTQKMIADPETMFSSTPDAIWIHGASVLKDDEYNVSTLEVKCPRKYNKFIPLWECETPEQLKKFNRNYYYQVLDQMDNCDSALGYFACFHPLFPSETNMRIIEFRKIDLWEDFKELKKRKAESQIIFKRLCSKFQLASSPIV